jgi:hypothetical protein
MSEIGALAALMEPIARLLLGEPNRRLSNKTEFRYGTHGSLAIDLAAGTFFDHETNHGGGVLDLVTRETGRTGADRMQWLEQHGFVNSHGGGQQGQPCIVASYPYRDEAGALLFEVVRLDPKDFRQRRPDPQAPGGWRWSVRGVRQVPYRLPDLLEPLGMGRVIFICEGEKDVDRLWQLGLPATCNAGGVGKWRPELTSFFSGADIAIIPDHDPQKKNPKTGAPMFHPDGRPILPGQDHAIEVARALNSVAERVRILDLAQFWPDMPLKGDVSDWLDSGPNSDALYALLERVEPWSPDQTFAAPGAVKIVSKPEFMRGFVAPDYLIDGILHRRYLYALTGQTGHAKTAIALLIAQLVASSDRHATLGSHRVEKGQVCYFVGENADDIRMRLIGSDALRSDSPEVDRIYFCPGVFNIGEMMAALGAEFDKRGGLDLVIVDTSAAYFLGSDEISNTEMASHARMLRQLTTLPGKPCVLVLCHPVKYVLDRTQLLPRGGGAFLAEMDGNLTIWKHDDILADFHYTKLRGPDFEPMTFRLEKIVPPKLVDANGRQLQTVRAVHGSQKDEDYQKKRFMDDEDHVLAHLLKNPQASLADIAVDNGWTFQTGEPAKSRVQKAIARLEKSKPALIQKNRDKWTLTEKGKATARVAALRFLREDEDDRGRLFDD